MRWRKSTPVEPWPEREPDLYIDGRPMWIQKPVEFKLVHDGNGSVYETRGFTVLG